MPICSLCGRSCEDQCPRCKYPDHMIASKYNKHGGGQPTSAHRPDPHAPKGKKHVWPKFDKDAKPPEIEPGKN